MGRGPPVLPEGCQRDGPWRGRPVVPASQTPGRGGSGICPCPSGCGGLAGSAGHGMSVNFFILRSCGCVGKAVGGPWGSGPDGQAVGGRFLPLVPPAGPWTRAWESGQAQLRLRPQRGGAPWPMLLAGPECSPVGLRGADFQPCPPCPGARRSQPGPGAADERAGEGVRWSHPGTRGLNPDPWRGPLHTKAPPLGVYLPGQCPEPSPLISPVQMWTNVPRGWPSVPTAASTLEGPLSVCATRATNWGPTVGSATVSGRWLAGTGLPGCGGAWDSSSAPRPPRAASLL